MTTDGFMEHTNRTTALSVRLFTQDKKGQTDHIQCITSFLQPLSSIQEVRMVCNVKEHTYIQTHTPVSVGGFWSSSYFSELSFPFSPSGTAAPTPGVLLRPATLFFLPNLTLYKSYNSILGHKLLIEYKCSVSIDI